MILRQLNLANFRGFEHLDIKFEKGVNVIAGVNGVGKSAILAALAVLFSRALPEFTLSEAKPLSLEDDDIHLNKSSLEVSGVFDFEDQQCHMGMQRLRGDIKGDQPNNFWRNQREAKIKRMSFAEMLASRTLTGELDKAKAETRRSLQKFRELSNQPVAIFFTPKRQLPGRPRTLPEPKPFEISNAYNFALNDREVELREFMDWFRWQQLPRGNNLANRKRVLDCLRQAVSDFVPEFQDLRLQESPLRFVVQKHATPLGLHQLSDGERGLLAMVFDITRRLSIANPALSDPIREGKAVVLIDEIELHLHPSWQRRVLRRFARTFQTCQFVVTTHSPQIIGQTKPSSLRLLRRERSGKVVLAPPVRQSFGMDSSWVLEEIMGTPARDFEIEQKLKAIHDAIDAGQLKKARSQVKALEKSLGLFPDLQEMKSMLDRFEILKKK